MVAGQINKGEIMSDPTIRQQCLAVARRFSAHLPEPLEPEDCDELMHYIEDLVTQRLTAEQAEVREQITYLQTISTAQVQQIRELETELRRAIATINCPELCTDRDRQWAKEKAVIACEHIMHIKQVSGSANETATAICSKCGYEL